MWVFFSVFQNFDFPVGQRGERAKNGPKLLKIVSVVLYISGTIYHMIFIYCTHICIKGHYLQVFFSVSQNSDFWDSAIEIQVLSTLAIKCQDKFKIFRFALAMHQQKKLPKIGITLVMA